MDKRLDPIVLTAEDGKEYTLQFNRKSVIYAENNGFTLEDLSDGKYMSGVSNLFFYAFRMHHPYMTHEQTDRILFDEMGGLPEGMIERLGALYAEPYNALIPSEDAGKNSRWAVKM